MGELVSFPALKPTPPRFRVYLGVIDEVEAIAKRLTSPEVCGHGDLLNLLCRIMVEHYGVEAALDMLDTATRLVTSAKGPTPPRGAA